MTSGLPAGKRHMRARGVHGKEPHPIFTRMQDKQDCTAVFPKHERTQLIIDEAVNPVYVTFIESLKLSFAG